MSTNLRFLAFLYKEIIVDKTIVPFLTDTIYTYLENSKLFYRVIYRNIDQFILFLNHLLFIM